MQALHALNTQSAPCTSSSSEEKPQNDDDDNDDASEATKQESKLWRPGEGRVVMETVGGGVVCLVFF